MNTVLSLPCDLNPSIHFQEISNDKNKLPVRFTGQHFTIDKVLIADAIKIAKINETDTVLDIGAGKGFITVHLVRQCINVIAIENDKSLLCILKISLPTITMSRLLIVILGVTLYQKKF